MRMMRSPVKDRERRRYRVRGAAVAALCAAGALAACGTSGSGGSAGSATSGTITWWGWTPTTTGAQTYIKAFNKTYPNIHVTFKEITIAGWDAALRPALASSAGPAVFDIAPGAGLTEFGTYAQDLTPAVKKALGSGWKSKLAAIGPVGLTTK